MQGKVDPVKTCRFQSCDLCIVEKGAIGLERDGTYFMNLPELCDEVRKPGVHHRLTRGIDVTFDPGSFELCDLLHCFQKILQLNFIAGGTGCGRRACINRAKRTV